jgi:hypothetical protein
MRQAMGRLLVRQSFGKTEGFEHRQLEGSNNIFINYFINSEILNSPKALSSL